MSTKGTICAATADDDSAFVHVYHECFDEENRVYVEIWERDIPSPNSHVFSVSAELWTKLVAEIRSKAITANATDCAVELSKFFCTPGEPGDGWVKEMAAIVDKYIRAAVDAEREACHNIATEEMAQKRRWAETAWKERHHERAERLHARADEATDIAYHIDARKQDDETDGAETENALTK